MEFIEPVRLQSRADDAQLIDVVSDHEVRSLFTAARDEDYEAIAKEARALAEAPRQDLNAMTQVEGRGSTGCSPAWRPSSRSVPRRRHLKVARRIRRLPWHT